ncbi:peptide chain release factor 2 [Buchnera aphidicola]|uniref:peptide chain release factor 2 n=1 Tax=Buchnera aphidicola TaxID=9 RepID=UPI0034643CC1
MIEKKLIKKLQDLQQQEKILKRRLEYNHKKIRIEEINIKLSNPKYWDNPSITYNLYKEKQKIEKIVLSLKKISSIIKKNMVLIQKNGSINNMQKNNNIIELDLEKVNRIIKKLDLYTMFQKKTDVLNCYLDIQSGSGGLDAQNWAKILLRMYLKWINKKGFKSLIIEETGSDSDGIKSATIYVSGPYAYGWLRTETGIHRLVRQSPFNSTKKRHTSFCSIFVYPEIQDDKKKINIKNNELRIDVYRSSGAGGQHVNKTESAVRITHIPTGIVTQSQNDRSQHKNKNQALKQMISKLNQLDIQNQNIKKKISEKSKADIRWGNQIRSYILDDARIKDIRTGIETTNIQEVLNGNLDQFIISSLKIGL